VKNICKGVDEVIKQDPPVGTPVEDGEKFLLYVNNEGGGILTPKITGLSKSAASRKLINSKLKVKFSTYIADVKSVQSGGYYNCEKSSTFTNISNIVGSQSPKPGKCVPENFKVTASTPVKEQIILSCTGKNEIPR